MDYIPKHFQSYELVPRETYKELEKLDKLYQVWWLFDPRILQAIDLIRKRYGRMVANTWWWGGKHHYRGFRPAGCTIGAKRSQHRFGRAVDLVPTQVSVEEIRSDIKGGEDFHWITCVEIDVSWLHVDVRNYKGLLIVYP